MTQESITYIYQNVQSFILSNTGVLNVVKFKYSLQKFGELIGVINF